MSQRSERRWWSEKRGEREGERVGFSEWKGRSAPAEGGQQQTLACAASLSLLMSEALGQATVGCVVFVDGCLADGVVGNGGGGRSKTGSQAGPVAVRTRVVSGRSQCTTSRVWRADWRGGWIYAHRVRCEDALVAARRLVAVVMGVLLLIVVMMLVDGSPLLHKVSCWQNALECRKDKQLTRRRGKCRHTINWKRRFCPGALHARERGRHAPTHLACRPCGRRYAILSLLTSSARPVSPIKPASLPPSPACAPRLFNQVPDSLGYPRLPPNLVRIADTSTTAASFSSTVCKHPLELLSHHVAVDLRRWPAPKTCSPVAVGAA